MAKKFQKVFCGNPLCESTIGFIVEEKIEIQCRKCGKKNIVDKTIQVEELKTSEPTRVVAKIA